MNHSKARRFGGKGTPRLPPKKLLVNPTDVIVDTLTKGFTPLSPKCAIINTPTEMQIFDKPVFKVFQGSSKLPVAYLLSGKYMAQKFPEKGISEEKEENISITNQDIDQNHVTDENVNEERIVDQMLEEESELRKDVLRDYQERGLEDQERFNGYGEVVEVDGAEKVKEKVKEIVGEDGLKRMDEYEEKSVEIEEKMEKNLGDEESDGKGNK